MSPPRVRFWTANYAPQWEAVSKEIDSLIHGLAGSIDGSVVGLQTRQARLVLRGPRKLIPLPPGLPLLPALARGVEVNHYFGSAGERWVTRLLARHRGVLTIAKATVGFGGIERNAPVLRRFLAVVAQSEREYDLMRQLGLPASTLRLIRPGVPLARYREATGPFTILFASSPFDASDFVSRGIYLLVRAAARMPDVRFLLVWRRHHAEKLRRLLADEGATNVEVHDGVVPDMGVMFDRVHATILPALEHRSFVPAPRSGLESLAHGKPLLASHYVAIAGRVEAAGAGVSFEPTLAGLEAAVRRLQADYGPAQASAQSYLAAHYSPDVHRELHLRLYRALGG